MRLVLGSSSKILEMCAKTWEIGTSLKPPGVGANSTANVVFPGSNDERHQKVEMHFLPLKIIADLRRL